MTAAARTESPAWPVFSLTLPFVAMCLGTPAAIVLAWQCGLPIHAVVSYVVMTHLIGLGVTMGFHRLFCHRAFQTSRAAERLLMILGCMAGQSSPFYWIATHRTHHRHSDRDGDPHSPHAGEPRRGWWRRFWHAHQGWTLETARYDPAAVRDLARRPDLSWIDRHWYAWYLLGLALPAAAGYVGGGTAYDALMGFLWGGLLRQAVSQQMTFAVNSVCHVWGSRAYPTGDSSRNNLLVGLFSLGEGWHNNHHAFPYSARHGFRWWQADFTWNVVWLLERVGVVWKVKRPKLGATPPDEPADAISPVADSRSPAHSQ